MLTLRRHGHQPQLKDSTLTNHQQPEALSLADWLDAVGNGSISTTAAAAELRRLHAESIEQARLLGMSAERELALRARVQELGRALKEGKVRAVTDLHAENEALMLPAPPAQGHVEEKRCHGPTISSSASAIASATL